MHFSRKPLTCGYVILLNNSQYFPRPRLRRGKRPRPPPTEPRSTEPRAAVPRCRSAFARPPSPSAFAFRLRLPLLRPASASCSVVLLLRPASASCLTELAMLVPCSPRSEKATRKGQREGVGDRAWPPRGVLRDVCSRELYAYGEPVSGRSSYDCRGRPASGY